MGVLITFPEDKSLRPVTDDQLKTLHDLYWAVSASVDEVYADLAAGAPMLATNYTLSAEKPELEFPIQFRESCRSQATKARPPREPKSIA